MTYYYKVKINDISCLIMNRKEVITKGKIKLKVIFIYFLVNNMYKL